MSPDVTVVGGGLAGIAAALRCADAGLSVTLLESRPKLGGLTHSFRRGEQWVDNGQHVFLRCCTDYREFLGRLGVAHLVHLQDRLRIPVLSPDAHWTLARTGLPAPLQLASALLRYDALSWPDRLRLGVAVAGMMRVDRDDPATDRVNFGEWLTRHHQSPRAVKALWDLITVPTLNAPASASSLALAATVFQLGLFTSKDASDIGWSAVPLQQLHGDAALSSLTAAGVDVRTGTKVEQIVPHRVRLRGNEVLESAAVVVATPPEVTDRLVDMSPWGLTDGWVDRLGHAPIVDVHVVLDRVVTDEPFFAAIDSPLEWVFDRTASAGLTTGQYLAVSLSAADEWIDVPAARVVHIIVDALSKVLPGVSEATVLDAFVTRERRATFRPAPGAAQWRPDSAHHVDGLTLAGAWTATGWPATMEGAVRSGNAAAATVVGLSVPHSGERVTAA